jgi:hypothetical protein
MIRLHPILKAVGINISAWVVFLLVLTGLYFAFVREWQMNWGATAEEVARYMPGDELLDDPELNATRAVEIEAPPEDIWPWIVQIGYGRAGFYSFDNLDNGGVHSSERILPEYQNLKVGDSIPSGEYQGELFYLMEVVEMEPEESMLWVFLEGTPWGGATWSWGLYRVDDERTRLVSRLRQKYDYSTPQGATMWSMCDVLEICMMRTTLLNIKRRAEAM